ncbi:MAG: hypothetical protein CMQ24_22710 [Gammaproteobacteria bacterium]|nr:hypothetical protein [Gammaproteobacteria bacterium]
MLTIGSLCSGIGGLDLAVERHYGATLAWHSDIDKQSNQVMQRHWPDALGIGDFTAIDPKTLPAIDLLSCGFPCQPVSTAGLQLGVNDERWLFDDIVEFVGNLRQPPKVMVFENVQGFLSNDHGNTARRVFGQIASMGYLLRYGVVRASDAGAPHRRARWFGLATLDANTSRPRLQRHWPRRELQEDLETSRTCWRDYARAVRHWESVIGRPAPSPTFLDSYKKPNPAFIEWMLGYPKGWITDVIHDRTGPYRLLGNSVCPPQAELALDLLDV